MTKNTAPVERQFASFSSAPIIPFRVKEYLQSWTKVLGHMHFFSENFPFSISPSPYQSWICGLKVHFFEATLTRGEGGRHFAQMWPFRVLKTQRLANTCHMLRLSQGLLSRIVVSVARFCLFCCCCCFFVLFCFGGGGGGGGGRRGCFFLSSQWPFFFQSSIFCSGLVSCLFLCNSEIIILSHHSPMSAQTRKLTT